MLKRRDFLKATLATTAALALTPPLARGQAAAPAPGPGPAPGGAKPPLPRRPYGKTGVELSILAFPGLALRGGEQPIVDRLIADAYDAGINYYDVAPQYGDSEIKLGPALRPYRAKVFLACKTAQRQVGPARAEFERSLQRLETDHFDLYQLHALRTLEKDLDPAFAKGGVMELIAEAKQAGKIKYVGFSAHTVEAALAALDRYPFDSVLFPITYSCWYAGDFGPQVAAKARAKGAAILGMKTMCRQVWRPESAVTRKDWPRCWYEPIVEPRDVEQALRFTLNQPGVTAAVPPADARLFRLALDAAPKVALTPLTAAETQQYQTLAAGLKPLFRVVDGKSQEA